MHQNPSQSMHSDDTFRLACDICGIETAIFSAGDTLKSANDPWLKSRGMDAATATGAPAQRCWPADDASERVALIARVRRSGVPVLFQEQQNGRSIESVLIPLVSGDVMALSSPTGFDRASWPARLPRPELVGEAADAAERVANLSRREREVFVLLAGGKSIKQVAETLGRSEKTIEGHRDSIYRKLNVRNRAQIAVLAIASGLLSSRAAGTMQG